MEASDAAADETTDAMAAVIGGEARIVSLVPAVTGIIVELGGVDRLVARSSGDPTPGLEGLPDVGEIFTPSLERLVAAEPTHLFVWPEVDWTATRRALGAGVEVETVSIASLDEYQAAVVHLGERLGMSEQATTIVQRLRSDRALRCVQRASARHPTSGAAPTALWVTWSRPPVVGGVDTHLDEMMLMAGVQNAASAELGPWPNLSMETVVRLDPDLLIWAVGGGNAGADVQSEAWQQVPAFAAGRVIEVDADLHHTPSLETPSRARALGRRIAELLTPENRQGDDPCLNRIPA